MGQEAMTKPSPRSSVKRGWQWAILATPGGYVPLLAVIVLLVLPVFVVESYHRHVLILILLYAAAGESWNLIGGYGGQFSLGHAAFFGIGAYTSTLLLRSFGLSPWLGMCLGAVFAVVMSFIVGLTCFRLRSHYFTIATIGFGEVLRLSSLYFRKITGGAEGLTIPYLGTKPLMYQFDSKVPYYYIILAFMLLTIYLTYRIRHSRLGYYLRAISQNQEAAQAVGVNVVQAKQMALSISAALTALLGTFYAQYLYFIEPASVFSLDTSILMPLVSIIGGVATVLGPIVGAFLIIPVREIALNLLGSSFAGAHFILYGAALIIIILVRPAGLIGILAEWYKAIAARLPGAKTTPGAPANTSGQNRTVRKEG